MPIVSPLIDAQTNEEGDSAALASGTSMNGNIAVPSQRNAASVTLTRSASLSSSKGCGGGSVAVTRNW